MTQRPVHTIINYFSVVKSTRTYVETLLIPYASTSTKNILLQAVPHYIIKLVHWAYEGLGLPAPSKVQGPDTRGLARSVDWITPA